MNAVYAVAGIVAILCFAIWLLRRVSKDQGRAEAEADMNKRMVENAEAVGNVILDAKAARDRVRSDIARNPSGLRDDDGFKRKD